MTRRPLLASLTALAVAVATTALAATGATAQPVPAAPDDTGGAGGPVVSAEPLASAKISEGLADATGQVTAFVQLDAPSGLDVAEQGGDAAAVQAATSDIEALAEDVVPADQSARSATTEPQRIATLSNLVSGALVTGDAAKLRALAESSDVVAVYRVTSKTPDNKNTDTFTRALQVWQDSGQTG
ncbi:MAG TPA: peptidase S8, partial [Cellulomonas sp.]